MRFGVAMWTRIFLTQGKNIETTGKTQIWLTGHHVTDPKNSWATKSLFAMPNHVEIVKVNVTVYFWNLGYWLRCFRPQRLPCLKPPSSTQGLVRHHQPYERSHAVQVQDLPWFWCPLLRRLGRWGDIVSCKRVKPFSTHDIECVVSDRAIRQLVKLWSEPKAMNEPLSFSGTRWCNTCSPWGVSIGLTHPLQKGFPTQP